MPGPTSCVFGNVRFSQGFDFTFGPGVQPSVCMLYTIPHTSGLPQVGILRFGTDGEPSLSFRDCLLEQPRLDSGPGGQRWRLPLLDRRWKWQFAHISGSYNIRKPDGSYLREKTPQELAALLLVEMGESGYDVSRLPNNARPERQWDDTPAAGELDRLCAELGCIPTLNPFLDRAEIWPIGQGATLPTGGTQGSAYAPVKLATPSNIRVDAGETWFQDTFTTEAVGLDTDGNWKPIAQLSYAPSNGYWSNAPEQGFPRFRGQTYTLDGKTLSVQDLAEATVFRCYRITGLLRGGWRPVAYDLYPHSPLLPVQSLRDVRLSDELADEVLSSDGGLRRLPAVAYVKAKLGERPVPANPIRYQYGFGLDATHGIIQFNEALWQFASGTNQAVPATVWYECAFRAGRDGLNHRIKFESNTGAPSTPQKIIQRPEILFRSIERYTSAGQPAGGETNYPDANQRLQYWYNAELAQYTQQDGGTVTYNRLLPIPIDGLTQQVTWSGGGKRPPQTIASQGQRHNRYIEPLDEYRDRLKAKLAEKNIDRILAHEFGGVLV